MPTVRGRATTLGALLEGSGLGANFGLLKIDVEGLDVDILKTLDTQRWRPSGIVVETHHWTAADALRDETLVAWTRKAGYVVVGHNRRNLILAEQTWLDRRFKDVKDAYVTLNPALYGPAKK